MKKTKLITLSAVFSAYIIAVLGLGACQQKKFQLKSEYTAQWYAPKTKITVRTESEFMKFGFYSDTLDVRIWMDTSSHAEVQIGEMRCSSVTVRENGGIFPPSFTGVMYIIDCGKVGKLFKADPLTEKDIEIWVSPLTNDTLNAEIRYMNKHSAFPMANLKLLRLN